MSTPAAERTSPGLLGGRGARSEMPASAPATGVGPIGILIGYARFAEFEVDLLRMRTR
jgi:hypothetical protein